MKGVLASVMVTMLTMLVLSCALSEGTSLDLSGNGWNGMESLASALDASADILQVDLTGAPLTAEERRTLLARYPQVDFLWTVPLCGLEVSSTATEVDLSGRWRGDLAELRDALDTLPHLESVWMWNCSLNRSDQVALSQEYPDVFFGWTITINSTHELRTDDTAFSTLGRKPQLMPSNTQAFTLCPNLLALDIGHNTIMDLSFLYDCSKLKVLILADDELEDITPLACQTELEYLELFMNRITDISALANMTQLRDVNLAYNDITDLSPLYELPHLERVWLMMNSRLTDEEVQRLREHQPDCEIVTRSDGATGEVMRQDGSLIPGSSWRDHPHYFTIRYIFHGGGYIGWDEEIPQYQ